MGELINLNASPGIADADIPAEIARDIEITAAIATHVGAADPHPIYLTQAEGDARYLNTGGGSGIAATIATSAIESALRKRFKSNIFIESHYLSSAGGGNFPSSGSNGGFVYTRAEIDRPGILGLSTGANAAGFVNSATGMGNNSSPLLLSEGNTKYFAILKIPTLRDITNDFVIEAGFQSAGTSIGLDACCFVYDSASNNWQCHTRNNSDLFTFTSNITVVANQWYEMQISVADGVATFAIDGVSALITSQKLPLASRMVGAGAEIRKIAGTSGRDILIDYQSVEQIFDNQNGETIAVLSRALTDADIPVGIARDSEVIEAIATHVGEIDPHPIYLTQAEGDARYSIIKQKVLTGTTPSTPGYSTSLDLGINPNNLIGFICMVGIDQGGGNILWLVPPGFPSPGYAFTATVYAGILSVRPGLSDSANMLNRPFKALIFYM